MTDHRSEPTRRDYGPQGCAERSAQLLAVLSVLVLALGHGWRKRGRR